MSILVIIKEIRIVVIFIEKTLHMYEKITAIVKNRIVYFVSGVN
ncbi:hypothetical protein CP02DC15_0327 [Chlamydia psittaci 02DC15]|nr:hypothetical protein B595_0673 [Chlamydia psittaci 84/55]EPJ12907.1 hypothetical protein CP02DC16_1040 [Chlamydia psittaci 02DC16]EPJ14549.1 hypothetical protein CP02DC15_0327 [Chlamydia psittaci 02DC15]EPJ15403.1 hypothetical protein CP02DC18_1047 [Chlamydia psittaci 02DC18]EPJ16599.1 hypothetical protein CP02DC22_1043 [Chlamydia psittaci 02DC22]EPJ18681.1 hypothetical protein CP01DC11_0313 [Chlamydia psittaci 01DC11]EPJ29179.1 hypothetical protein CPC1998_0316 [Chlamydia psittaci C19/98]